MLTSIHDENKIKCDTIPVDAGSYGAQLNEREGAVDPSPFADTFFLLQTFEPDSFLNSFLNAPGSNCGNAPIFLAQTRLGIEAELRCVCVCENSPESL